MSEQRRTEETYRLKQIFECEVLWREHAPVNCGADLTCMVHNSINSVILHHFIPVGFKWHWHTVQGNYHTTTFKVVIIMKFRFGICSLALPPPLLCWQDMKQPQGHWELKVIKHPHYATEAFSFGTFIINNFRLTNFNAHRRRNKKVQD